MIKPTISVSRWNIERFTIAFKLFRDAVYGAKIFGKDLEKLQEISIETDKNALPEVVRSR